MFWTKNGEILIHYTQLNNTLLTFKVRFIFGNKRSETPRTFGMGICSTTEISILLKITDHFHFECTETHSAENGFSVHQSELGALNLLSMGFVI